MKTSSAKSRIEQLFSEALEQETDSARRDFLQSACAENPAERNRVESLLAAHNRAGGFLQSPPALVDLSEFPPPEDGFTLRGDGPGSAHPTRVDGVGDGTGDTLADTLSFLDPPSRPDDLGEFAGYCITELVGRGGAGIVLKAFDRALNRTVALKVLAPELASQPRARQRFLREARAAAAVKHKHVVAIHAIDEAAVLPFLVMEFIPGDTLHSLLERQQRLLPDEILRISRQIVAGLAEAHAQRLVHRDIKPANILIEESTGDVKLTDFGLARAVDDVQITQEGMITGTPQFMSPEQATGAPVDHRSDLFSLGSVLYALCAGHPPFRADSTVALLRQICDDTPASVSKQRPDLDPRLTSLIDDLLAKSPDARPQSAAVVLDRLNAAVEPAESSSAQTRSTSRQGVLIGAAVLFAMLIALAVWQPWTSPKQETGNPQANINSNTAAGTGPVSVPKKQTPEERRKRNELFFEEDVEPLTEIRRMTVPVTDFRKRQLNGLAVSADGIQVYASCTDGVVYCWDARNGKLIRRFRGPGPAASRIALSPDGTRLAGCYADSKVRIWNAENGRIERTLPFNLRVRHLAFSPDGTEVVIALAGLRAPRKPGAGSRWPKFVRPGRLEIWSVATGRKLRVCEQPPMPTSFGAVDWSPDGKYIAAGSLLGHVQLYDASGAKFLKQLTASGRPGPAYAVRFSQDGHSLFGTGSGNFVWNWAVPTGVERASRIFSQSVSRFHVSDDGRWLAAAGHLEVRLLPLSADGFGKSVIPVEGHTSPTSRVAFIPGADVLVSCGWGGTVRLWRLPDAATFKTLKLEPMPLVKKLNGVDGFATDTTGDGRFDKIDVKGADLMVTGGRGVKPREVALLEFKIPKTPGRRIVAANLIARVTLVNASNRQPETDADVIVYPGDGKITPEDATRKGKRVSVIYRFTKNRLGKIHISIDAKTMTEMLADGGHIGIRIAITRGDRMIFASRETYFKNSAPVLQLYTRRRIRTAVP